MADTIGRVVVSAPVNSGLAFPLKPSDYGYGMSQDYKVVEHRFGDLATLGVQRYAVGSGARRFHFVKSSINYAERQALTGFYDTVQGSYQSFTYPVPNTDRQTFTNTNVVFDVAPLSITDLVNRAQTGLTFLEIIDPASAPTLDVGSVATFPFASVAQALATDVQQIIPLLHIRVRNAAVPDIYLSDRRVNVNGFPGAANPTTFLPRLLSMGVPGAGDVIMSQSIDGKADNVRFVLGNADRTMSKLVNNCSLEFAQIDLSLFHVQTSTLIQLWKGLIMSWQVDGSAQFGVSCSDGLYPVTQSYPPRTISRQCWKPFDQDILPGYRPCPWSTTAGHTGDSTSCDYFFNSPNGCLSHGMSNFFGGHPEQPQSVVIKDDGTGIIGGFFRSTVTSTSILSDSIWGNPLQEIWCNDFGSPQRAFWASCQVAAVRAESTYIDLLGIVGAGPIGAFEGMSVQTNIDGYKFAVAPTADGYFPQGFKVDGNLNVQVSTILGLVIPQNLNLGLRQSVGNDPAYLAQNPQQGIDAFSLGQGTPQTWNEADPNFSNLPGLPNQIMPYAAGTTLCEIRYPTPPGTGIFPTTAESHTMSVPIALGLEGSVFDADGNQTITPGITNPYWVAANSYFRALGINNAPASTQLKYLVLPSITNAQGEGCADIAGLWVAPIVGNVIPGFIMTAAGQALLYANLDYYNNTFTWQDSYTSSSIHTISIAQAISDGYVVQGSTANQEPQFMFQGSVAEFKPFRDWLTEILNCAMGWFSFDFGALKMGIRYSAVPTESFTVGSMLYQSLTITPISAKFEHLRLSFANVELQYQQDLAEYCDKDHATYYNRAVNPLTSDMRSVGTSTLSQGLRVATSRTREEIGGIMRGVPYGTPPVADVTTDPYIEWDNNKRASWKSTLLALTTEIGQVVAVQHPDLPTYPGAHPASRDGSNGPFEPNTWPFRIEKWMLHADWSVSIQARSCVDSMYDLEVGPQPTGVGPRPLPVMFYPEALQQWAPCQIQAAGNDALFPSEFTFNLRQTFQYQGDGVLLTSAVVGGLLPVNRFVPDCGPPDIKKGNIVWSPTGGFIPGGTTLFVQVCAAMVDTTGTPEVYTQWSPPSEILVLQVPIGTDTNTLTINGIKWPSVSALNGYAIFANTMEDLICGQQNALGLPDSITLLGPIARQTYAVPDYDVDRLRLRAQVLIHGGVLGGGADTVTSSTITSAETADLTGQDNWTGRVLAIIGRQQNGGYGPFEHFNITDWDALTGEYTLDRDPTAGINPVQPGDFFTVCFLGADNSANPYVIGDSGLINASYPNGETPNDPNRIGRMIRVIKGTSRGQSAKIVSNTATQYKLDRPLPIDATSVWIVVDPGWNYLKDVVVDNADPSKTTVSAIEINNYNALALLVEGVVIDSEGVTVDDSNAPARMLWIPGVQGTTNMVAS